VTVGGRANTIGSELMVGGKFKPTWESLGQYECPEWFRDAKVGIWRKRMRLTQDVS